MEIETYVGEPDKERLIAAMRGEKVDRVPNFEVLIEDEHVEKLLGRKAGNTLAVGGDPAKGIEESQNARPMYPEDYIEICNITGQDVIVVEALWTPFRKIKDGKSVIVGDRSVRTRQDFEKLIMPGDADIEEHLKYIREYKKAVSGTKIGVAVLFGALFQTVYEFLFKMNDFMLLIYDDRDFIEEVLEVSTRYWVKFVKAVIKEGVDIMYPADDIAYKSGLFIRPEIFKPMWLPRVKRIFGPILNAELPILFHSDGKLDEIIEDLIDAGITCLTPMDPYGIDYRDYKKRYGHRVALHGNIDIEDPLVEGSPQDVQRDVKEHMDVLKPGGGYVAGSSHSIVNYIPHENFVSMINAFHKYGLY